LRLFIIAAGICGIVLLALATYGLYARLLAPKIATTSAHPRTEHLSIIVLPFTNLSTDPTQDYFADGVTENLTTELSRIPQSFVIARNTAFTYRDKRIDAKEIGKELGVRYVAPPRAGLDYVVWGAPVWRRRLGKMRREHSARPICPKSAISFNTTSEGTGRSCRLRLDTAWLIYLGIVAADDRFVRC
jgi:hypothetical protein